MAIFTNWILGCQNVNVAGQRAAGKTHTVNNLARFLPEKGGMFNLSRGSEKNVWYQAEGLRSHSHIMIPELNKLGKEMVETLKEWGEGRTATYDVTEKQGARWVSVKKSLPPRPFIFCLADEEELKMDEQLRSRLTVVRMDISEEQNIRVMQQKAELAERPFNVNETDPVESKNMRLHIATMPPFDESCFRHPAATAFVECIPNIFTDCRRDFPKYINNTYGITRFHWKDRIHMRLAGRDKVFLVAPQDMYYNHLIYGEALVDSALRCSNMERQLIAILQAEPHKEMMDKPTLQKHIRRLGMNVSAQMLTKYMDNLADQGYVEVSKLGAQSARYGVGALFKDFKFSVDWKKVLLTCQRNIAEYYPEQLEEYTRRFIDNPVCVHPFTGVMIDLRTIGIQEATSDHKHEKLKPVMLNFEQKMQKGTDAESVS
jgi:hypothetical protein